MDNSEKEKEKNNEDVFLTKKEFDLCSSSFSSYIANHSSNNTALKDFLLKIEFKLLKITSNGN